MIIKHPKKVVVLSVVLLMVIGLVFIYSASGPYTQLTGRSLWYFFAKQSMWALAAIAAMILLSVLNYRKYMKLSPALLIISFTLLVWVLVSPAQLNVHRWLGFGFLRFQPSEVFKLSLVAYLSYVLIDQKDRPREPKKLLPHLAIAFAGILLIVKQPDLGTAALVSSAAVTLLFLAGLRLRYLFASALAMIAVGVIMIFGLGYERDRVDAYVAALKDPLGTTDEVNKLPGYYHNRQSLISIGSGGLLGCGLGGGGQKNLFLPAPHTDFIFSASAEEGGLLLCSIILGLLLLILMGSFRIARSASDLRGYLLASGLGTMIALQAVINIGVAMGLLPITGITLPFFSYGGSSLIISCAAVGMILSVARHGGSPPVRVLRVR